MCLCMCTLLLVVCLPATIDQIAQQIPDEKRFRTILHYARFDIPVWLNKRKTELCDFLQRGSLNTPVHGFSASMSVVMREYFRRPFAFVSPSRLSTQKNAGSVLVLAAATAYYAIYTRTLKSGVHKSSSYYVHVRCVALQNEWCAQQTNPNPRQSMPLFHNRAKRDEDGSRSRDASTVFAPCLNVSIYFLAFALNYRLMCERRRFCATAHSNMHHILVGGVWDEKCASLLWWAWYPSANEEQWLAAGRESCARYAVRFHWRMAERTDCDENDYVLRAARRVTYHEDEYFMCSNNNGCMYVHMYMVFCVFRGERINAVIDQKCAFTV